MTVELWALLGAMMLLWLSLLIQQIFIDKVGGTKYALSNRDGPVPNATPLNNRLDRVVRNHAEGLAIFAPLVLIGASAGISNSWTQLAAVAIVVLRFLHFFFYATGITPFRSIVWGIGFFLATPAFIYGLVSSVDLPF